MSRIREVLRVGDQRIAVGSALLVVATAVGGAALLTGGGDRSVEVGGGLVSNPATGASVTLPDGWQDLPRVERPTPSEILVVGTAPRPEGEPIEACGTSNAVPTTRSGYLTLYEYDAHGPYPSPAGDMEYPYDMIPPRPPDFSLEYGWGGGDCSSGVQPILSDAHGPDPPPSVVEPIDPTSTTTIDPTTTTAPTTTTLPPPANHLRELVFTESERVFVARIVTIDDPSNELLTQAYTILNSLRLEVPSVTTTTVYVGPPTEDTARQQILDAMHAAFGAITPVPFADSIEGGHPLATEEQKRAAAEIAKNADPITRGAYEAAQERAIVVRINWLEWESPTRARLNFDLLAHGEQITANTTGYAVYENDHWRMGRATWCEIAARGGVHCPT
jgi:hypothetical protein